MSMNKDDFHIKSPKKNTNTDYCMSLAGLVEDLISIKRCYSHLDVSNIASFNNDLSISSNSITTAKRNDNRQSTIQRCNSENNLKSISKPSKDSCKHEPQQPFHHTIKLHVQSNDDPKVSKTTSATGPSGHLENKSFFMCSKCHCMKVVEADDSNDEENSDVSKPRDELYESNYKTSYLDPNKVDYLERTIRRPSKLLLPVMEKPSRSILCPDKKIRSNSIPYEMLSRYAKCEISSIEETENENDDQINFDDFHEKHLSEKHSLHPKDLSNRSSLGHLGEIITHRRSSMLKPDMNVPNVSAITPFNDLEVPIMTRIRRASLMFNTTVHTNSISLHKQTELPLSSEKLAIRSTSPTQGSACKQYTKPAGNALLKSCTNKKPLENIKSKFPIRHQSTRRVQKKSNAVIRHQLGKRRKLIERRRHLADFSLFFALFGIFVMFIDAELIFTEIIKTSGVYSNVLRSLISVSTVVLIALILLYHAYDILVFSCDDCIEDWRIAVDYTRIILVIIEITICLFHPVPGFHWHNPLPRDFVNGGHLKFNQTEVVHTSRCQVENIILPVIRDYNIYLLLSLPMIGRLYLVLRVLLLHGKMFNDAGSRSIGAMNKVSFDVRFVLKTLMTIFPGTVLTVFILTVWIVMTWTLRACERRQIDQPNLSKCGWLIAVTFLSIGYGDIVPVTSCGKFIAISCGLMGSACTALVVAVFSRKLELSKAEKYVIHFMTANKLNKNTKYYAANVLRETWLIYKHTKLQKNVNPSKVRLHQRKFLQAIHELRRMKVLQRELQDESNSLVDLTKLQANVFETVVAISLRQDCIQRRMENLETILTNIGDIVQKKATQTP